MKRPSRCHNVHIFVSPAGEAYYHGPARELTFVRHKETEGVGAFECGQNAFQPCQRGKTMKGLAVRTGMVSYSPPVFQKAVLGPDAGIIEPCGY